MKNNKNNNNNINITKSAEIMGFGFFGILFIFFGLIIGGIIIFERDVPDEGRENLLGYIGGTLITIFCIYIVYTLSGRMFTVMNQEIDAGMVAYIFIILMILFLAN